MWTYLPCVGSLASKDITLYILHSSITGSTKSKYQHGTKHKYLVENVLYFPQSPINILSVIEFAKQLQDIEGTGIDTKQLRSCFNWDCNKFEVTIFDLYSNLPEVSNNEDFS